MPTELSFNLGLDQLPAITEGESTYDVYKLYNAVRILAYKLDEILTGSSSSEFQYKTEAYYLNSVPAGTFLYMYSDGSVNRCDAGVAGNIIGFTDAAVTVGDLADVRLFGYFTGFSFTTPDIGKPVGIDAGGALVVSPTSGMQIVGVITNSTTIFFCPSYSLIP
jgi:hypothetical protein